MEQNKRDGQGKEKSGNGGNMEGHVLDREAGVEPQTSGRAIEDINESDNGNGGGESSRGQ